MRHRTLITRLLIIIIVSVAMVLSIELYAVLHNFLATDTEAFRLDHPIDAPYWSVAFVQEYRHIHTNLTNNNYWKITDYQGTAYHFKNGERWIPVAPASYEHTFWLFGNSGLVDVWLPDNLTAANLLQQLMSTAGCQCRIVNRSTNAQNINGERLWLADTPLRIGDVVIFIDGAMDTKTDTQRFNEVSNEARLYATRHGALFYHFLQPHYDWRPSAGMNGTPLYIPPQMFVETAHMDEHGAALEAREIYNTLTVF